VTILLSPSLKEIRMLRYALHRSAQMAIVVFGVVTLVFFILRIASGDPARLMNPPGQQEELVQLTRERIGTDRPIMVQYVDYLVGLSRFDLGSSFHGGQPVLDEILKAVPNSALLALVTILFSSTVALIVGIAAALSADKLFDRLVLVYVSLALATPSFWLAIVLVLFFSVRLRWLPAIDLEGPQSFVLPVITLAVALTPVLIRTVRQSFLETLGDDHVRAARARGIPERRVILVHGLKVASLPLITLIGLQMGLILAGSYVVEFIFNWPGIGKLTLDAVAGRNFPMIQGGVLVAALAFVIVNFLVDLTYAALDPRIRLRSQ
jgi:peptide/nickel transport system permease protein